MSESDTPRTDLEERHSDDISDHVVRASFARQLERELAEATKATKRHLPPRAFAEMVLKYPLSIGEPVYYSEWPTREGPASYDADR